MNSLSEVPARYRGVPAIEKMAGKLDSMRQRQGLMRRQQRETTSAPAMLEQSVATGIGAALAGVGMAQGWSEGAIGAAGGGLAILGMVMQQAPLVHAANGMLAPLVAGAAARWWAQSKATNTAPKGA